jgi:hypothetical protein
MSELSPEQVEVYALANEIRLRLEQPQPELHEQKIKDYAVSLQSCLSFIIPLKIFCPRIMPWFLPEQQILLANGFMSLN